jgi:lysozyme
MTAHDIAVLRAELKRDEGLRLFPYVDSVGKVTIGYGRNLTDNGINQEEAAAMLEQDIQRHVSDLIIAFPWVLTLDPARQIVLGNMAFNLGITRLRLFKRFLASVQAGQYAQAAIEMLESRWAEQVGPRATRLASVMHSGEIK